MRAGRQTERQTDLFTEAGGRLRLAEGCATEVSSSSEGRQTERQTDLFTEAGGRLRLAEG